MEDPNQTPKLVIKKNNVGLDKLNPISDDNLALED